MVLGSAGSSEVKVLENSNVSKVERLVVVGVGVVVVVGEEEEAATVDDDALRRVVDSKGIVE